VFPLNFSGADPYVYIIKTSEFPERVPTERFPLLMTSGGLWSAGPSAILLPPALRSLGPEGLLSRHQTKRCGRRSLGPCGAKIIEANAELTHDDANNLV